MRLPVYRGYSVRELERMYSHRHRIHDYDSYPERWRRESAAARQSATNHFEFAYGTHPLERYDVFPAGPDAPVLVFFHGGYWHSQDKSNFLFPAPGFVDAGVTFVGANYPLCPDTDMPRLIESCQRCIAHVRDSCERFGGARDCIHVSGHSAGGHIAAMLLSRDAAVKGQESRERAVCGALAISGIYDLSPLRHLAVNDRLHLDSLVVEGMSPIKNIPEHAANLVLAVGDGEGEEFLRQQRAYARHWRNRGHLCDEVVLADANHFSILDSLSRPDGVLFRKALAMMRSR